MENEEVKIVREKSGNLEKKQESQGILTGCLNLKVLPQVQLDDLSFFQNNISRSQGKRRLKKVATLSELFFDLRNYHGVVKSNSS